LTASPNHTPGPAHAANAETMRRTRPITEKRCAAEGAAEKFNSEKKLMIEKITAFRTTDGEYFENLQQAIDYQRKIERELNMGKWLNDNLDPVSASFMAEHAPNVSVVPLWHLSLFISRHGELLEAIQKIQKRQSSKTENILLIEE